MLKNLVTSGVAAVILLAGAVPAANAQGVMPDRAVYFTFSAPVTLPQTTLPAGKYLFRLADSQTTRSIVQIFGEDRKLVTMLMTQPAQRDKAADQAEVYFLETAAETAPAIGSYWLPGEKMGWEFIYPRSQATKIAAASKHPVLATKTDNLTTDQMKDADLVRVSPTGDEIPVNSKSDTTMADLNGKKQMGQAAPTNAQAPQPVTPAPSTATRPAPVTPPPDQPTASTSAAAERDSTPRARHDLPATASNTPIVAALGVAALFAAFALAQLRRRQA